MYITIFFLQECVAIGRCCAAPAVPMVPPAPVTFSTPWSVRGFAEMLRDDACRYIGAASQGKATMILSGWLGYC